MRHENVAVDTPVGREKSIVFLVGHGGPTLHSNTTISQFNDVQTRSRFSLITWTGQTLIASMMSASCCGSG